LLLELGELQAGSDSPQGRSYIPRWLWPESAVFTWTRRFAVRPWHWRWRHLASSSNYTVGTPSWRRRHDIRRL